jgi:hypothetical protein
MALRKRDYDSILKEDYHGPIVDQLENSAALVARLERFEEPTGGRYFYLPTRTSRTAAIGARNDGDSETLPTSGRPGYAQATFPVKSLYATVRLTGLTLRTSKKDTYAFARAQVRDMEDTVKDLKKDVNRQLFADGSAELGLVNATVTCSITTTSQAFTLNSTLGSVLYPTKPTRFLYAGERVDFRTRSTGALILGGAVVASVDSVTAATFTFTITTTTTIGGTCIICRENNIGLDSAAVATYEIKEPFGLFAALHASSPGDIWGTNANIAGDYGNIDRTAANSYWKGNRLFNSSVLRPLSLNLLQQGIDEAETVGGGEISLLQTNYPIFRVYGSMLATMKQADVMAMKLDGGWDALAVGGKPMVKDVDSPDYVVFCIDESTLMLGVTDQWNWVDEDGILSRLPGQDQYEAVMVRDLQLISDKPVASTIIGDIAHS